MSYYQLTFNSIVCKMPSAGVEISSTEAYTRVSETLKPFLNSSAEIVSLLGPEGEVAGAAIEIIGEAMEVGAEIAQLVVAIETHVREDGGDPDQFYISWTPDYSHPLPAEDLDNNNGSVAYYPLRGVSPSNGANMVVLPKNAAAPNMPVTLTAPNAGGAFCFWDWDYGSGDDLLCVFPIDDAHCGTFQKTLYNGMEDCTYYVDWTLTKVQDPPVPTPLPPTITTTTNPTSIYWNGLLHDVYRNSIGHIIDVTTNLSNGDQFVIDMTNTAGGGTFNLPPDTNGQIVTVQLTSPAIAQSDIFPYIDPNNNLHLFYVDVYNTISDVYYNGTAWCYKNITYAACGAALPGTNFMEWLITSNSFTGYRLSPITIGQETHVMYSDVTGNISDLYTTDLSDWNYQNISSFVGGKPYTAGIGSIGSNPKPIVYTNSQNTDEVHVFYMGDDEHLYDIYNDGSSWKYIDISAATHDMQVIWDPSPVIFNNQIHVLCNVKTYIYDAVYSGSSWQCNYVPSTYQQVGIVGTPSPVVYQDRYLQVFFRDVTGQMIDASIDSGNLPADWMITYLFTKVQGAVNAITGQPNGDSNSPAPSGIYGQPYGYMAGDLLQVIYTDSNCNISVINYNGSTWAYGTLPGQQ